MQPARTAILMLCPTAANSMIGRRPIRSTRGIGIKVASQYSRPLNPETSRLVLRDMPRVFWKMTGLSNG